MPDTRDINEMKTDVEILKKDVSNIQGLWSRLDTAIDKIADASNGISRILAVHQHSINALQDDVQERKRIAEKETELLHSRISDMKDESAQHHTKNHTAVMAKLESMSASVDLELREIKDRVATLERWKWWIMGGSWSIGFIIAIVLQLSGFIELFVN